MDKMNYVVKPEKYQERVLELFRDLVSDEFYSMWADTFEIERVTEKRIVVAYYGSESIKNFKKACGEILFSCICSIMGVGRKIKIHKRKGRKPAPSKTKKNVKAFNFFVIGMIFVCFATSVIVILCSYIVNRNFRETFYITSSIKVDSSVRVIQLSDLHNASYGQGNKELLRRVEALNPDIIICTGDMVNSAKDDVDYAVSLAKGLSEIAPAYYIYGNNEVESIYDVPLNQTELDKKFGFDDSNRDEYALLQIEDSFEEALESTGIKVLKNEKDTIEVKGMAIDVFGVLTSNPSSFWSYAAHSFADYINENPDNLKITAIHEPFIFQEFKPDFWGDMMICGHTHGGVARLPILGPVFTHEGGLLPERNGDFVYGRYDVAGKTLFVSGGLEHSNVLRVNNQPELVIIDINKF